MKKKKWIFLCFLCCCTWGASAQERFLELLKDELAQQMKQLQTREYPPYYMNYRVVDEHKISVTASFGHLINDRNAHSRSFVPQVRIGSPETDNFEMLDLGIAQPSIGYLPVDENFSEESLRQKLWKETAERYKFAVDILQKAEGMHKITVEQEDRSASFSKAPVEHYYEAPFTPQQITINRKEWQEKVKKISAVLKNYPELSEGEATLSFQARRNYFISTEGTEVVHNQTYTTLMISGYTRTEDGRELPLYCSFFAYRPEGLPSMEVILAETQKMAQKLTELHKAPEVDPYSGPVLLSGAAGGVFFHEIFGHRVEGQRMRNEQDGQTFKKMIGEKVLPESLQVFDDPTLQQYGQQDLNGFYRYDEQGVKAQRVNVVVDGKMNDFLMTRKPLDGHPFSNGHARAAGGWDPVSRQSNLIVETKDFKTEEELRDLFRNELKTQKKEFGYYFKKVSGGFTQVNKVAINSFTVKPLEVYKVYADGRPDQLVRGVSLIGTPLAMFSNIMYAGGESEIFNGVCGAESGPVPVSAVSPALLVKQVEVQREPKSSKEHQLLKRP